MITSVAASSTSPVDLYRFVSLLRSLLFQLPSFVSLSLSGAAQTTRGATEWVLPVNTCGKPKSVSWDIRFFVPQPQNVTMQRRWAQESRVAIAKQLILPFPFTCRAHRHSAPTHPATLDTAWNILLRLLHKLTPPINPLDLLAESYRMIHQGKIGIWCPKAPKTYLNTASSSRRPPTSPSCLPLRNRERDFELCFEPLRKSTFFCFFSSTHFLLSFSTFKAIFSASYWLLCCISYVPPVTVHNN